MFATTIVQRIGHAETRYLLLRDREAPQKDREARERERAAKKFPGLLEPRPCARRGFPKEHRDEFGPIGKAYGILRVPESEYHGYVKRRKSNARIEREALEGLAAERLGLHKGRYGYRRINRELRRDGIVVSEK